MKAFIVDGEWSPKKDYPLSEDEKRHKKAITGSQVWRNPEFEIKDIPTPNFKEDEVLIRVKVCGICGSDTHLYETDEEGYIIYSGLTKFPSIIGHEFSGVIEKTGKKVMGLTTGDVVTVESIMWCGVCRACRSGAPNQCEQVELMGLSINGAFAEYVTVKAKSCWKINSLTKLYSEEDVFNIGALIEPAGCAYNGMFIAGGGFNPGSTIVVYGAGPIGLAAIALARIAGASIIIAFDLIDERIDLARKMGADFAFNVNKMEGCGPANKVMELTDGWGAEMQIEAAGAATKTIPEMEKSLSIQGKIVYLGRSTTKSLIYLDLLVSGANKIIGSRGHVGYGIYDNIIKLIRSGKLDLLHMITSRFHFDDLPAALKKSSNRTDGKIIININPK